MLDYLISNRVLVVDRCQEHVFDGDVFEFTPAFRVNDVELGAGVFEFIIQVLEEPAFLVIPDLQEGDREFIAVVELLSGVNNHALDFFLVIGLPISDHNEDRGLGVGAIGFLAIQISLNAGLQHASSVRAAVGGVLREDLLDARRCRVVLGLPRAIEHRHRDTVVVEFLADASNGFGLFLRPGETGLSARTVVLGHATGVVNQDLEVKLARSVIVMVIGTPLIECFVLIPKVS